MDKTVVLVALFEVRATQQKKRFVKIYSVGEGDDGAPDAPTEKHKLTEGDRVKLGGEEGKKGGMRGGGSKKLLFKEDEVSVGQHAVKCLRHSFSPVSAL